MAGPALTAHVFVACGAIQWDGPAGPTTTRTLERVGYTYFTETPDGFPHESEFWFFARLAHTRRREFTRELYVTAVWHDDPQSRGEMWTRHILTATFRPASPVRDFAVPISLVFEGPGRYEFRLWYPVTRAWDSTPRQRHLTSTHVCMEG